MLVPSMTNEEIRQRFLKEYEQKQPLIANFGDQFQRIVKKATKFPVEKMYERASSEGTVYFFQFFADKKSDWKTPMFHYHAFYNTACGRYALMLGEDEVVTVFPPHFFSRYKERVLKDSTIDTVEAMKLFVERNNATGMVKIEDDSYKALPYDYENMSLTDRLDFFGICDEGVIFGTMEGKTKIVKTIITDDMIFPEQLQLFNDMKQKFIEFKDNYYRDRFPNESTPTLAELQHLLLNFLNLMKMTDTEKCEILNIFGDKADNLCAFLGILDSYCDFDENGPKRLPPKEEIKEGAIAICSKK